MDRIINNASIKDDFLLIKSMMEKKGLRFTRQRRLMLLQLFMADGHLSAEELHESLSEFNIGIATVYRNVKLFASIGIIKAIVVDGVSYYEMKIYSKKPLHLHFQCIECSDILDIDERKVALEYLKLNKIIENIHDLEIYDVDIMLIGLCETCRK